MDVGEAGRGPIGRILDAVTGKGERLDIRVDQDSRIIERMSSRLSYLYGYWRARHHADGSLPRRADVDPIEIARQAPELLPHIWLLDVMRNPYRFRYRLIGGAIIEAGSPSRVGEIIEPPRSGDRHVSLYGNLVQLCEKRTWNYRCGRPTLAHSRHVEVVERLSLPLVDESGEVAVVLSASLYSWEPGWGVNSREG